MGIFHKPDRRLSQLSAAVANSFKYLSQYHTSPPQSLIDHARVHRYVLIKSAMT